jgi:hypothetical protein
MKVWMLAALFTAAMAPAAWADESTAECQLDESRRAPPPRTETAAPAALATTVRPAVAPRETAEQMATRAEASRRRSGKRIPDAELIGPRGAL